MNNMRYDGQFSSDRTNDTHFHEIDLITEYNSHDDILRITYKMDNIIMEHGLLLGSFELASNFSNVPNKSKVPECFHVFAQLKFLFQPGGFHQSRASVHRWFSSERDSERKGESTFNLNSVISARGSSIVCHRIFSYVMTGWVSLISWSLLECLVCWKNFFPFRILAECLKNGLLVSLIFSWKKSSVSLGAVSIITSLSF